MRPIDADEIIKVAEHAYHEWNLAMAAADTNRQVNLTYKMQDLCKAVKAVAEAAPAIDPESMRPTGEWEDEYGGQFENPRYRCSVCKEKAFFKLDRDCLGGWHEIQALTPYCPICGARLKGAGKDAAD